MIGRTNANSNLGEQVYYVTGRDTEYTFTSPITGYLAIYGHYSTKGFYVTVNGTNVFNLTESGGKYGFALRRVPITKGNRVTVYAQVVYLGVLATSLDEDDTKFSTNL